MAIRRAMIVQYLAINYPDLIKKLILAITSPQASETVGTWIDIAKKGNYKVLMIDTVEKSYSEHYMKNIKYFLLFIPFTRENSKASQRQILIRILS